MNAVNSDKLLRNNPNFCFLSSAYFKFLQSFNSILVGWVIESAFERSSIALLNLPEMFRLNQSGKMPFCCCARKHKLTQLSKILSNAIRGWHKIQRSVNGTWMFSAPFSSFCIQKYQNVSKYKVLQTSDKNSRAARWC